MTKASYENFVEFHAKSIVRDLGNSGQVVKVKSLIEELMQESFIDRHTYEFVLFNAPQNFSPLDIQLQTGLSFICLLRLANYARFMGITHPWKQDCHSTIKRYSRFVGVGDHEGDRWRANLGFNQYACSRQTVNRRIALIRAALRDHAVPYIGFLGDDDLVSLGCARAGLSQIFVIDLDSSLLQYISEHANHAGVGSYISTLCHNLFLGPPPCVLRRFGIVFMDPPYSRNGAEAFLRTGLESLAGTSDDCLFVCLPRRARRSWRKFLDSIWCHYGLYAAEIKGSFNRYPLIDIVPGEYFVTPEGIEVDIHVKTTTIEEEARDVGLWGRELYAVVSDLWILRRRCRVGGGH